MTTKIDLFADPRSRSLVLATTPGQREDNPMFELLMQSMKLPRSTSRPRTRTDRILGDKAYSSRANRDYLSKSKSKRPVSRRVN